MTSRWEEWVGDIDERVCQVLKILKSGEGYMGVHLSYFSFIYMFEDFHNIKLKEKKNK